MAISLVIVVDLVGCMHSFFFLDIQRRRLVPCYFFVDSGIVTFCAANVLLG